MNSQLLNTLIIVAGSALLLYAVITASDNVYIKIIGLILLMYGLYNATQKWVKDNKGDVNDEEND
ncbi:hypothetical protein [Haloflavibacter putidus]|uniref:Group-specific protein n=1 Tax=Haloflavibacter putidus TaxID=2576776 RepID=A0A507ZU75_9FLAO|nr:hypothetical protein [Haloflavibacter putidus]TQD39298.1 hypothetical protein FKR84_05215 [Haloflavibacter putidus]